ncbi:hypothetical protein KUCAC02_010798, partial [Chaenocephalus aceratus]
RGVCVFFNLFHLLEFPFNAIRQSSERTSRQKRRLLQGKLFPSLWCFVLIGGPVVEVYNVETPE